MSWLVEGMSQVIPDILPQTSFDLRFFLPYANLFLLKLKVFCLKVPLSSRNTDHWSTVDVTGLSVLNK